MLNVLSYQERIRLDPRDPDQLDTSPGSLNFVTLGYFFGAATDNFLPTAIRP
jgi:hypothetical protein